MCRGCALMYCITLAPGWYIFKPTTCFNYKICIIEFFMQNKDVRCFFNLVNILKLELSISAPNIWNRVYLIWGYFVWHNRIAVPEFDGILPKGPYGHAYAWQIGPFWQDTLKLWTTQDRFVGMWLMRVAVKKNVMSYISYDVFLIWFIHFDGLFSMVDIFHCDSIILLQKRPWSLIIEMPAAGTLIHNFKYHV